VASFTTPCTVALGVVSQKVVYLEVDSGKRVEEPVGVDVESAEPRVDREFLSGHVALTSFGTTIVKAVALGHPAYVLDLGGLRPLLRKAVPTRSVKGREFGAWEQVWNTPIFLSDKNPNGGCGGVESRRASSHKCRPLRCRAGKEGVGRGGGVAEGGRPHVELHLPPRTHAG
jgi:hypothetical protein